MRTNGGSFWLACHNDLPPASAGFFDPGGFPWKFESGRCEDKSLHEMSGFADYESWCQVICETLRNEPGDPEEGMEEYEERKERVNRICDLCSYRGL